MTCLPEMTGAQADVTHKGIPVRGAFQGRPMVTSSWGSCFRGLRLKTSKPVRRFALLHRQCSGHVLFIQAPGHTGFGICRGPVSCHMNAGCGAGDKVAQKRGAIYCTLERAK